ncbi:MAG: hypothetical protein OEY93_11835, partial [Anaerolineae bacterium]|nr:hypothetical protein [Anaerolineae bacterium]
VSEEIGPEGGVLTITSPDGVIFTLTIPAEALPESVIITLAPVQSIDGFPLSGGMLAAVNIRPEQLELFEPAILTIEFPEEISIPEGMVLMNFGYLGSGYDFHFVPKYEGGSVVGQSSGSKLSVSVPYQNSAGSSGAQGSQLKSVGVGAGTSGEMRNTMTNNTPKSKSAQDSSQAAATQIDDELAPLVPPPDDELAPLVPPPDDELAPLEDIPWQAKIAKEIEHAAAAASKPEEVIAVIDRFKNFYDSYGSDPDLQKYIEPIWDALLKTTKDMFEKNKKKCLSKDDMIIQGVAAQMLSPLGKFWKIFKDKFVARYGSKLLNDISNHVKECKLFLKISSVLNYYYLDSTVSTAVEITVPLRYRYGREGIYVLTGIGPLKYIHYDIYGDGCQNFNPNTMTGSKMILDELRPIYDANDNLVNFKLQYYKFQGKQEKMTGTCEESMGKGWSIAGTGDAWGSVYTAAHHPDKWLVESWDMHKLEYGESGILAEKLFFVENGAAFPTGKYGENTMYTVVKKETKKK